MKYKSRYRTRCQACDQDFQASRRNTKYCSSACRVRAHRARQESAGVTETVTDRGPGVSDSAPGVTDKKQGGVDWSSSIATARASRRFFDDDRPRL